MAKPQENSQKAKISAVVADGKAACDEQFKQLKSMTNDELADALPPFIGRLNHDQIASLFVPARRLKNTEFPLDSGAGVDSQYTNDWLENMLLFPPSLVASGAALFAMMMSIVVTTNIHFADNIFVKKEIVRPMVTDFWPPCSRLSAKIDGCVYRVQSIISMENVALHLAMPIEEIMRTNPQISANQAVLPAYTPLVIWRGVGSIHQ